MSYNNGPTIVRDGLTFCCDIANPKSFVSGSNTIYDLSLNRYTASLFNGPTYTGSNNGSLVFDGSNDHAIVTSSIIVAGTQVSCCFWTIIPTRLNTTMISISNSGSNPNGGNIFGIFIYPYGGSSAGVIFDAGRDQYPHGPVDRASVIVNDFRDVFERWNYWCFTKNSSTQIMNIYRNGQLISSAGSKYIPINAGFGNATLFFDGSSNYLNGRMSMFQFYSKELSATEVRQNYDATKGRFGL